MNKRAVIIDLLIVLGFVLVTVIALIQVPRISIDGSIDAFIPKDHPIFEINESMESTFGSMDSMVLAVSVTFGSVLEPEVLSLIDQMTQDLESDNQVESVTSITNVDYVASDDAGMTVVPLVESFDASGARLAKRRIVEWQEAYVGAIVSDDLKTTALVIQPRVDATGTGLSEIYDHMRRLVVEHQSANVAMHTSGAQAYEEEIRNNVARDVIYLIPTAAALIILVLWLSFRRFLGVLFPMIGIAVAGVWVVGIVGMLGITFTMATLLVPVLLLVVGSAYGIHVMQHFYEDLSRETGFVSYERLREIVSGGVGTVRTPVLMAGVTTAAGFIAQLSSPLGPFRVFGLLSAAGIAAALLTSLLLIPALLRLRYRRGVDATAFARPQAGSERAHRGRGTRRLIPVVERFVANRKALMLGGTLALVALTTSP